MKILSGLATLLLVVGGLNWGSIGAFHYDFVVQLLTNVPHGPAIIQGVYIAVGVAAVFVLLLALKRR